MGCGSSSTAGPPPQRQQQQQRPVQPVQPTKQQQQQSISAQPTNTQQPKQQETQQTNGSQQTPQENVPTEQANQAATKKIDIDVQANDHYEDEQTDIEVKQVQINKDLLDQYLQAEKEIRLLESKGNVKNLKAMTEQVQDLDTTLQQLEEQHKKCQNITAKEKADVDNMQSQSVRGFFKQQGQYEDALSKEQEEYLEALTQQEVVKKDLDGVTKQRDKIQQELEVNKGDATKLFEAYKKQEELLASVFDGKYGSEQEYKLEAELDVLLDKKQRISVARYKWHNARVLLHHACNQLAFAVKRWQDLGRVHASNLQQRYAVATETRNNLVAASQNVTSAQRHLNTITFPYCKPEELQTLDKAVHHIYVDMQSAVRQQHALGCYSTTHKRAAALIQWFDSVINSTILKDLENSKKAVMDKERELKQERVRLLKQKVDNNDGGDIDIPEDDDYESDDDFAPELALLNDPDSVSIADDLPQGENGDVAGESLAPPGSDVAPAPTPLPLNELAPPPNTEDLFGDVEEIKRQHEQEMEEFKKAQGINKARMDQGLQERLRARQSRRKRQMAQEQAEQSSKQNLSYMNVLKAVLKVSI